MPPQTEVHPCWRVGRGEIDGMPRIDAAMRVSLCHATGQRSIRIRFAIENGNGNEIEQIPPGPPGRQLQQIVRTDQPYEVPASVPHQPTHRIHCITCADLLFQIRDDQSRIARDDLLGRRHARRQVRHIPV